MRWSVLIAFRMPFPKRYPTRAEGNTRRDMPSLVRPGGSQIPGSHHARMASIHRFD
jgi:hypothetical protein